jgi:uncharacterized protein YndB with AHSA1/START domain
MRKELTVKKTLEIQASPTEVWKTLTDPEKVKLYFYGTVVKSDWKVGYPITFSGELEGKAYKDKGTILAIENEKLLQYNYWSSFSGLEDKEENYSLVTYQLDQKDGNTVLTLLQQGFASEKAWEHAENGWQMVLTGLKKLVEK